MNRHIEKYLDHYLEIPTPDYAVMLKGEWGCGKTYFIKKYIKAKKDKKICYISLNGIKQCNDVIPQILLALAPKEFNSKICKGVISIGRTIAYGITKFFNVDNVFNIGDLANCVPENIVFVFDDLERTLLEPKEVLGFLSDLVEQQNFHVIIIGDETKFIEDAQEEYLSRKEKIIGKTFSIQNQDAEVLPALIKTFADTGLEDLLHEHLDTILLEISRVNKYCEREQVNYRIINAAIREFYFAFEGIFKNEQLKEYRSTIFGELFLRFLVIFYCLQTKFLTIDDVKVCSEYFMLDEEKTEKRTDFRETFPAWTGDTFIDIENWINIFDHRPVNASDLIKHIRDRVKPDIPNWKKLLHFYSMNDEDIEITHEAVKKEISEQKHKNPFVILHIFMTLVDMSKKGFINTPTSEIVSDAKKYLDSIGSDLSWNDVSADINFYWESYDGYGYHATHSDEFKETTAYLAMKMREKCKENIDECYKKFINDITEDDRAYAKICSPEYQRADIFSDSDPDVLWNKLINLNPKAFREITHYLVRDVVSHHLSYKRYTKQIGFWKKIISLGEKFLDEHPNDNKSKCLQLREDFLPQLRKMVSQYEQ
ncbi:MAG: hypothetical protein E7054_08440 [Lentisphaerae bacterium]|nr:hypothetical protein [Lentisphaerota bacterium]